MKEENQGKLVEVFIALSVVALLATILIPMLSHFITNDRIVEQVKAMQPLQKKISQVMSDKGGSQDFSKIISTKVAGVSVSNTGEITIQNEDFSENAKIILTPSLDASTKKVDWKCIGENMPQSDLPKECQATVK